jgi:hypothetical protein
MNRYNIEHATVAALGSIPKSCGVGPSPKLQASPEPSNVVAEDRQADLDESNQMISEGGPSG